MDLHFKVEEGQKSYIEKIDIRGNVKTKDKVIRRELTISPGDVFNMVGVKRSKQRLEGLQYFEKVDARPDPDPSAEPQEPHRRGRGKEHRQPFLRRGFQFRGLDRGFRGVEPGQL